MDWTDDQVKTLTEMWEDGSSAAEIATVCGTTRNAVIGKSRRLNLTRRKSGTHSPIMKRQKSSTPSRVFGPVLPVAKPKRPKPVKPGKPISLIDLTGTSCRFPVAYDRRNGHLFCGRMSAFGFPYCAFHCRIAYQPAGGQPHQTYGESHGKTS